MISLKKTISKGLSWGVSMQATRSSKYSLDPLEPKGCENGEERACRRKQTSACPVRENLRDRNLSVRDLRLVKVERAAAIASGEMHPE